MGVTASTGLCQKILVLVTVATARVSSAILFDTEAGAYTRSLFSST
jgi:hypothetical protein